MRLLPKILVKEVFGGFPLTLPPFVEVWLEEALVELGHAPKSGSSVEKVEFFVVFFVDLGLIVLIALGLKLTKIFIRLRFR